MKRRQRRKSSKRKCRCNPAGYSPVEMGVAGAAAGASGYFLAKHAMDAASVGLLRGVDQHAAFEIADQGVKGIEVLSLVMGVGGALASVLGREGSALRTLGSMSAVGGAGLYGGACAGGLRKLRSSEKFLPA